MAKLERYSKNLELQGLSQEQQYKLMSSKVLVMGAGGLGSGVIMNLAALGVGQIKILDCGILEESDFNRGIIHKYKNKNRSKVMSAKDWIQEYNSDIKVDLDKIKLNELNYLNTIQGYDIIVDCFDSYEAKYMLNNIALHHNKILVHGGIQGLCGQVTTIVPKKTGCLSCVMQKPISHRSEVLATLSPMVNMISALQAQEVLKIITGIAEPLLNRILIYDGTRSEFKTLSFSKNINCETCSHIGV